MDLSKAMRGKGPFGINKLSVQRLVRLQASWWHKRKTLPTLLICPTSILSYVNGSNTFGIMEIFVNGNSSMEGKS